MDAMMEACATQLRSLHEEIKELVRALPPEALDWASGPEMNSPAILVVHVAGAERWLIGDMAGGEPSGRVRDTEFVTHERTAEELCALLDTTLAHSLGVLERLTAGAAAREWKHPRSGEVHTAAWGIVHAVDHAATHLGHLEMTRQLWERRGR